MWLIGHIIFGLLISRVLSFDKSKTLVFVIASIIPDFTRLFWYIFKWPIEMQRPWFSHSLIAALYLGILTSIIVTRSVKLWKIGFFGALFHLVFDTFFYIYFGVRWFGPLINEPLGYRLIISGYILQDGLVSFIMLIILLLVINYKFTLLKYSYFKKLFKGKVGNIDG